MIEEQYRQAPWVIAQVKNELYGFSTLRVQEMVLVPDITRVPRSPNHVRGMINLRGSIIPLFDLRMMLGLESSGEEVSTLVQNLEQRERDHVNWLDALFKAVSDDVPFTGQLDPHKCAFGMWYDNFHTDNMLLESVLRKFDAPHKAIHGVGEEVNKLTAAKDFDAAHRLIDRTRDGELHEMIRLFGEAKDILRTDMREIAIVLSGPGGKISVSADKVVSVEVLKDDTFGDVPMAAEGIDTELMSGIARRVRDNAVVVLMDSDIFLGAASQSTAA